MTDRDDHHDHDHDHEGPLQGLKVLDLTRLLPGPLATRRLARWGAEVLKIEDPGPGDGAARWLNEPFLYRFFRVDRLIRTSLDNDERLRPRNN